MAQSEHIIKNYDMLLSHGETKTRKVALDIAEAAIQRAIPYHETLRLIQRTPESISIGERTIFLREIDHIYVVGVGKGAYPIAQALEEKLGDLIDEGIVLVKKGDTRRLKRIEIIESGHPLPDQAGIDGAKKILSILQKAGERDLIFAPITGGSSAMMNLPDYIGGFKKNQRCLAQERRKHWKDERCAQAFVQNERRPLGRICETGRNPYTDSGYGAARHAMAGFKSG